MLRHEVNLRGWRNIKSKYSLSLCPPTPHPPCVCVRACVLVCVCVWGGGGAYNKLYALGFISVNAREMLRARYTLLQKKQKWNGINLRKTCGHHQDWTFPSFPVAKAVDWRCWSIWTAGGSSGLLNMALYSPRSKQGCIEDRQCWSRWKPQYTNPKDWPFQKSSLVYSGSALWNSLPDSQPSSTETFKSRYMSYIMRWFVGIACYIWWFDFTVLCLPCITHLPTRCCLLMIS